MSRFIQQQIFLLKQELLKRARHPLRTYIPDETEGHNQLIIHKSAAKFKLIFGGNQSGKTITSAAEMAWWLLGTHPYRPEVNIKPRHIWVIGPEYRMLVEGIWRHLRPEGKDHNGIGFLPHDRIIKEGQKVPNHDLPTYLEIAHNTINDIGKPRKSTVSFISGEGGESARRRLQAAAKDLVVIDEEIDTILFKEILVRTLATDGELINSATLVRSEDYLVELEERAEAGDPEVLLTRLSTAKNKYLSERSKIETFKGMSKEELDVRLEGKSRRRHGLVYPEFNDSLLVNSFPNDHNISTLIPPPTWKTVCAMDPGHRVWAALWFAINPEDNTFWWYREMYLKETNIDEVAAFIKRNETEKVNSRVIDPKAFARAESGQISIGAQLSMYYGLSFAPAQNDRDAGINAVHRALPKSKIFNHLYNFKKEFRSYKLKTDTSSSQQDSKIDSPFKKQDHLMDSCRYGVMHCIGHLIPQAKRSNFRPGHSLLEISQGFVPDWKKEKIAHFALGTEW